MTKRGLKTWARAALTVAAIPLGLALNGCSSASSGGATNLTLSGSFVFSVAFRSANEINELRTYR